MLACQADYNMIQAHNTHQLWFISVTVPSNLYREFRISQAIYACAIFYTGSVHNDKGYKVE